MDNTLILFDCFGVIITESAPVWFANRFDKETAAKLKDEYFHPGDLGQITMTEIAEKLEERFGYDAKETMEILYNAARPKPETIELISRIKPHNHLAILSNIVPEMIGCIESQYDFRSNFEKIFYSCEHKLAKPDIAYYKMAIASYGKKFDKIFMIDDNQANLDPLGEIGVIPIRFTSAEQLEKDLRSHGVDIDEK